MPVGDEHNTQVPDARRDADSRRALLRRIAASGYAAPVTLAVLSAAPTATEASTTSGICITPDCPPED